MKIKPFRSIGGLTLHLYDDAGSNKSFGSLHVSREDLSAVAIACINEINMDASPELIQLCKEVTEATST